MQLRQKMNEKQTKEISQAEWKVMKVLWSIGSGAARDVSKLTQQHYGMTDSTTRTYLSRLVDKGHIKTTQIGNSYLYEPISPMVETICKAADELLDNTPNQITSSLVQHMVKNGKLSGDDIQELRKLLDDYDKKSKNENNKKRK